MGYCTFYPTATTTTTTTITTCRLHLNAIVMGID